MSTDRRIRELERAANAHCDEDMRLRAQRALDRATLLPEVTQDAWDGEGLKSKPRHGAGVTMSSGSDCYPGTITKVSKSGHRIEVRRDRVVRVSGNFMDGDWVGTYHDDYSVERVTAHTRRKKNKRCAYCGRCYHHAIKRCTAHDCSDQVPVWRPVYSPSGSMSMLVIGSRRYYQDPHF